MSRLPIILFLVVILIIVAMIDRSNENYYKMVDTCLSTGGTWIADNNGSSNGICLRNMGGLVNE